MAADPGGPRPVGPEGALRVRVQRDAAGRVSACRIDSTRPDVATALLQGRSVGVVAAAVPRLFAICGVSQGVACRLALAAAVGDVPDAATLAREQAAVATETLRETARRLLLDAPRALGEVPTTEAVAAMRSAMGPAPDAALLARALFGEPLSDWLARVTPAAMSAWAETGVTAPARQLRGLWHVAAGRAAAPLLESPPGNALLASIARASQSQPAFARAPTLNGQPAETGALARGRHDPLVALLLAEGPPRRAAARHVARLRELAHGLAGAPSPALAGALPLADGWGLGWVENARGLLVHLAQVEGARALQYRIVAPTEWNFHPAGALPLAGVGMTTENTQTLRIRMVQEVESLDPCVQCEIEIQDA